MPSPVVLANTRRGEQRAKRPSRVTTWRWRRKAGKATAARSSHLPPPAQLVLLLITGKLGASISKIRQVIVLTARRQILHVCMPSRCLPGVDTAVARTCHRDVDFRFAPRAASAYATYVARVSATGRD